MTIDVGEIRNAAISASIFWPPDTEIKTGRWAAIDRMINKLQPKIVLTMCDEIERLRKDAEAWDMAVRAKDRLARCPVDATQDMREQIIETAQAKGYWSVWMTVFADDPVLLLKLERK